MNACTTGKLEEALVKIHQGNNIPKAQPQEVDLESLRKQAKEILAGAVGDGRLESAIRSASGARKTSNSESAGGPPARTQDEDRSTVLESNATEDAVKDAVETVFAEAINYHEAAARDPEYLAVSRPGSAEKATLTVEEMRVRTAEVLMQATEDGTLLEAVQTLVNRKAGAAQRASDASAQSAMQQDIGVMPAKPSEPRPAESRPFVAGDALSLKALEAQIRKRNERFRRENEALRRENLRLKDAWDTCELAAKQAEANAKLRQDLVKLGQKVRPTA